MINTLQDYMARTEAITYLLMPLFLIGIAFFWKFLTGRDEDHEKKNMEESEYGSHDGRVLERH